MGVATRGDPPDDLAVVPDRLVADDVGAITPWVGVDSPCEQTTLRPLCLGCRQRLAADEVALVELHEAAEAGLVRVVDRPILAAPRAKALVEAKRIERVQAEQPQAQVFTFALQQVERRPLSTRRHPELITQVAGERDPPAPHGDRTQVELAEVHEPECLAGHVGRGEPLEQCSRLWAGDGETTEVPAQRAVCDVGAGRDRLIEPTLVEPGCHARTEHDEAFLVTRVLRCTTGRCGARTFGSAGGRPKTGDGEIADELAVVVDHRRQDHSPRSREPIGDDRIEIAPRIRAAEDELGEAGCLHDSDPAANSEGFFANGVPGVGAAEGDLLNGVEPWLLEPQCAFESVRVTPDRVFSDEPVVDRRRFERACGREHLVGELDTEPSAVVLLHLLARVLERGVVAVPCDIHPPDVEAWIAVGHPVGERQADTAALAEPGHDGACAPEAGEAADRTEQRVAVGGEGERAVDDLFDTGVLEHGEVTKADVERLCDPVEVGGEEPHAEVPRCLLDRPWFAALLVRAEQQPAAFLTHVDLAAEVDAVQDLAVFGVVVGDGGDVLGQQVHVLHGEHRQLDAGHAADLAGPEATGVDDVFAADGALYLATGCLDDLDVPAFGGSSQRADPTVAVNGSAVVSGALGVRVGHAGGIDVTFVGVVHRSHEVLLLEQRHELLRLRDADELGVHSEVPTASVSHAQPVHALLAVGQHESAGQMNSTVATR